jgi:hypothetical protein
VILGPFAFEWAKKSRAFMPFPHMRRPSSRPIEAKVFLRVLGEVITTRVLVEYVILMRQLVHCMG